MEDFENGYTRYRNKIATKEIAKLARTLLSLDSRISWRIYRRFYPTYDYRNNSPATSWTHSCGTAGIVGETYFLYVFQWCKII